MTRATFQQAIALDTKIKDLKAHLSSCVSEGPDAPAFVQILMERHNITDDAAVAINNLAIDDFQRQIAANEKAFSEL